MTDTINEAIEKLAWQYVAGPGCANCWGDMHQGCESTCRSSEEAASERKTFVEEVHRIATLAAAEERGACARAVEALPERLIGVDDEITDMDFEQTKTDIAAAIRARGQGNEKTV